METIYGDIAARCGGNIYLGVVGPVRTGKSTLVKKIMEELVLPAIPDPYRAERARDELPQCGSGKTIMTAEPKFVPEEAVEVSPDGTAKIRIRMIDSVGYMVPGAMGAQEDGNPRMVTTPWFDHEIPLTQAAELGTKKVMEGHATMGLVVTTDGSITDISRQDYAQAERKAILDMAATGKPFLVVINSRSPESPQARELKEELDEIYGINALILDCQGASKEDIRQLFAAMLYSFPMSAMEVYLPRWMDALEGGHPVKAALFAGLLELAQSIPSLGQAKGLLPKLAELPQVRGYSLKGLQPATGTVAVAVDFPESLFYEILSQRSGISVESDSQLLERFTELGRIKREYDRLQDALNAVKATGYGVVKPAPEELHLQKPEMLKRGNTYGVKLRATAPSIHLMRVDVDTEISPMVGDEKQSRELIDFLQGESPETLWQSNIFGKSVYEMIQEGLNAKLSRLPEEVRGKFRGTLGRIVNEGATGLVCIIL